MLRGLRWGVGYAYVLAMHILNQTKVEFEFEFFNLPICMYIYINEWKGLMRVNSAKSANSVICISYNKRLFGRPHDHIPHLVAGKVVGI